jgi:hypothetical protein
MNLIEISEQLKDVPDQLLMKEVQSPSGAYPSYLVVTEMTRRKRMRDQAMKEAPSTTVVQDLTQPSREQMMAAMAATQRGMTPSSQLVSPEAPPPQAQQMSQPAPRLNAPGIMASPQATQALAAQDVMGAQEPRRMAAGGMVAFADGGDIKYDDRGAIRFQNQGVVPRYTRFEELPIYIAPERERIGPASSMGELFSNIGTGMYNTISDITPSPAYIRRVDPVTNKPISFGEFMRLQERERADAAAPASRAIIENTLRASPIAAGNFAASNPQEAAALALRDPVFAQRLEEARGGQTQPQTSVVFKNASNPRAANAPGGGGGGGGGGGSTRQPSLNLGKVPTLNLTPFSDPYATEAKANIAAFRATREPTAKEIETARAAEEARYGEKVPFRMGFLEKDISKREKDIEGRRASNINEALIQTGLGVMRSKSPRFLGALGEGGTEGLSAYRQGLKDIRDGEKDILQSKVSLANAQTLYDQGKFTAGEKAEEKSYKQYERGISRLNSESAIIARNQNQSLQEAQLRQQGEVAQNTAGLNALKIQMEQQKLPYEISETQARTGYYNRMPNAQGGGRGTDTTPSPAEIGAAQKIARDSVMQEIVAGKSNVKLMTPEFNQLVEQRTQEIIRQSGKVYTPLQPITPQVTPGQLPPGWSVQQVQPAR